MDKSIKVKVKTNKALPFLKKNQTVTLVPIQYEKDTIRCYEETYFNRELSRHIVILPEVKAKKGDFTGSYKVVLKDGRSYTEWQLRNVIGNTSLDSIFEKIKA